MSRKILCSYSITFVRLQVLEVQLVLDTCLAGSGEGAVVLQQVLLVRGQSLLQFAFRESSIT